MAKNLAKMFSNYWIGNLVLSQKFGNFSRTNAAFSKLLFVIFQYHQTVSLHPHMHRTVWRTVLLKQNRAQTWPPWPKFATPFYANGFTFSSENLSDISRYHTLFKTYFWRFKKNYIAELWDRMSFSDFRSAVRSFIVLRHFFTEFDRFLLVLSKQLCLVVKTTVLCCFPGCGGSPLTSITTAYYAVMRAWRNLLLVAVLRSNWSNVLLIYRQLHHTTPKITRNIQGNPNLRLG